MILFGVRLGSTAHAGGRHDLLVKGVDGVASAVDAESGLGLPTAHAAVRLEEAFVVHLNAHPLEVLGVHRVADSEEDSTDDEPDLFGLWFV